MKLSVVMMLVLGVSSFGSTVQFSLSPSGADVDVGLSPSNVVPAIQTSTGSGDLVSGGIVLDTDSRVLQLAVGYGSSAGFTDLSGPAQTFQLRGPAAVGQNVTTGFDLAPFSFPAANPALGGIVLGALTLPPEVVSNFVAGHYYVTIGTAANPDGELRGQIVPLLVVNQPPIVSCGAADEVECGTPAEAMALVSDPDGDALTVVWSLNGVPFQTNMVPASSPPVATPVTWTGVLPLGANVVSVNVTDAANNTASCSTVFTVVDTTPPVITAATTNPKTLWPPNHKMVPITVRVAATDTCGAVTWKITRVTSNEPVNGLGDGDTSPDWQITGNHGLKLRAERSGRGNGRVYSITVEAKDESGNTATKTIAVTVPKSQGRK